MKIVDIAPQAVTPADTIKALKKRQDAPDIGKYTKELDPAKHKIMITDASGPWPDKPIKDKEGNIKYIHRVTRISIALQKLIVKRSASFTFGNEPTLSCTPADTQEEKVLKAVKRILDDSKCFAINRQVMRAVSSYTEAAERWFTVEKKGFTKYGFDTGNRKLRVQVFSADEGDTLYPLFDRTGDMIAFSREYKVTEDGRDITYFETETDEELVLWRIDGNVTTEVQREDNPTGMINTVYAKQKEVEWADVQTEIEQLELLLSRFGETNRYFAAPKGVVKGTVKGWSPAGSVGELIEVAGQDAEVKYLTWDQAPESVRLEIEKLFDIIYSVTQTPNISFDNVKGIGALSGIALKLMFLDAHLKVMDKKEIYIPYLQRRISILCGYIAVMNAGLLKAAKSISIMPEITPYMIVDELAEAQVLTTLTASKPILSQKTAIAKSDMVDDPEEEYNQIQTEQKASAQRDIFETTT